MEQLWNNLPCGELDRAEISSLEDGRSHVASQVGEPHRNRRAGRACPHDTDIRHEL